MKAYSSINNETFVVFIVREVMKVLQIEAEIEEEAKWTGGDDDEDENGIRFKIDELVCVRDDARGGRDAAHCFFRLLFLEQERGTRRACRSDKLVMQNVA